MSTRKELKEQYKQSRPEMGVFKIESPATGQRWLFASANLNGLMNRYRFQLGRGSHPNRALQAEWTRQGGQDGGGMVMEVLERLDYDKDEAKTDYAEELDLLRVIWLERLEGAEGRPAAG